MGQSSLFGAERAPAIPEGRDVDALGPSDTSDSGSDVAGADTLEAGDAMLPVDIAMADDRPNPDAALGARGSDSDAAGTGERRGPGGEGLDDGADIGFDRIVRRPDAPDGGPLKADDTGLLEDDSADAGSDAADGGDGD